jgi:glycosyltransferase involved in cell wall biosynthesis
MTMPREARPRSVLLVGPLPIDGDVIGGTKVSFAALVAALQDDPALAVTVHDTSRPQTGKGRAARALLDLRGLVRLLAALADPRRRLDVVMFNTSSGGALKSGPLVWAMCRVRRVPLVVRVFGGDLDLFLDAASRPTRALGARTILRADRVLLQTRALCARFADPARVECLPTTRDVCVERAPVTHARRFLFLAQLRREKGVIEAVTAARALPAGASLTVCGPAMAGFDIESLAPHARWRFAGAVASADVPRVLAEHDVLVFPSYHAGEGLPGIVIEAMQAGLPVIAARFRALGELVEDDVNGLLVAPRDVAELSAAMLRLVEDPELVTRLAAGARRTGDAYRPGPWLARLRGWLGVPGVETEPARSALSAPSPTSPPAPGTAAPRAATPSDRGRTAPTSPSTPARRRG